MPVQSQREQRVSPDCPELSNLHEGGAGGPRTLFLDFDGVLMPSPPRIGFSAFVWLPRLHALLAPHPDVRIVLHTSWRFHQSVDHMSSQLQTLMPRVAGATSGDARYPSIAAWVAHHRPVAYLILDDQAAEYPNPVPAELVLCDPRLGITDSRASGALRRWLGATAAVHRGSDDQQSEDCRPGTGTRDGPYWV